MFVPSRRELEKWDKVGQKSAFRLPAVTIFVTFVKDQGVTRMFTPSLRVYHTCQEVFLFRYSYSSSNCPGLQTRDHGSQKESRRRLAALQYGRGSWVIDPHVLQKTPPCPTVTRITNISERAKHATERLSAAGRLQKGRCTLIGRASPTALPRGKPGRWSRSCRRRAASKRTESGELRMEYVVGNFFAKFWDKSRK